MMYFVQHTFLPSHYIPGGVSKLLNGNAVPTLLLLPKPACTTSRKPPRKRPAPEEELETHESSPSSPTKGELRLLLEVRNDEIVDLQKKVKTLQQKLRRKTSKIENMGNIIGELKERCLVSPTVASVLDNNFSGVSLDVIRNHFSNKGKKSQGHRHSEEAKRFAVTLHFYSPRAYEYVRTIFDLPHPRSISAWTSTVSCEPGFFGDVFNHLKSMALNDPVNRDCALIFDGMAIHQDTSFSKILGRMLGYVDYGEDIALDEDEEGQIASEALIFMLNSLKSHWKYPIGYVFIDKIKADAQKALVARALESSLEAGLNVKTVTCDGTPTNLSTMKKLGCNIGQTLDDLDGTFTLNGTKYLFTPDPPHMLKLARNALSDLRVFIDGDGHKIQWKYITMLHDEQKEEGIKFGNKLSAKHVFYHRYKMNVRLAAQTFSSSVADALEFLQSMEVAGFEEVNGTIKFIRVIDRLFDLLNSRSPRGRGFKSPMHRGNMHVWSSVIDNSISYLVKLRDENGNLLLQNRRHTFVKGMVIAAKSAKNLAMDLLFHPVTPYKYVLNYKWSQDHIELLNSCIRGRNGNNNNPNAPQFKSSMKKILMHASISSSRHANCLSFDENNSPPIFSLKFTKNRSGVPAEKDDSNADIEILPYIESLDAVSEVKLNTLSHIAGFIVRGLLKKISCEDCSKAMISADRTKRSLTLIAIKDNGGLVYPSDDVVSIVTTCEKYFKMYVRGNGEENNSSKTLFAQLKNTIIADLSITRPTHLLFSSLLQHDIDMHYVDEDYHSTQIMKAVVTRFISLRLLRYGQEYTENVVKKGKLGKRQQMNKLMLFSGL